MPLGSFHAIGRRQWQKAPDPLNVSTLLALAQSREAHAWCTRLKEEPIKKNLTRNPPAERSASCVDALQRSLTIRSFDHRAVVKRQTRALQTLGSVWQFCDFCVDCPCGQKRKIPDRLLGRFTLKTSRNAKPNAWTPAPPGKNFAAV